MAYATETEIMIDGEFDADDFGNEFDAVPLMEMDSDDDGLSSLGLAIDEDRYFG